MFMKIDPRISLLREGSGDVPSAAGHRVWVAVPVQTTDFAEAEHDPSFVLPSLKHFMKTETPQEWPSLWLNGKCFVLVRHQKAIDSSDSKGKPSLAYG